MELDIKTVTGGPLDVNIYVVGVSGSNQCVLIDPGAECGGQRRGLRQRGQGGAAHARAFRSHALRQTVAEGRREALCA